MAEQNYEKSVLCAVLEDPEALVELAPLLEPEDFSDKRHRALWGALQGLMQARQRPDAVRIAGLIEDKKLDVELAYVDELRAYLPSIGQLSTQGVVAWAERVRDISKRSRLLARLSDVVTEARKEMHPASRIASDALTAIVSHQEGRSIQGFRPLSEARDELEELIRQWESGIVADKEPTGFPRLDEKIGGGLGKGHLIVIGGRPGTYKTSMSWLILRNIAQRIKDSGEAGCVAFASLEMTRADVIKRGACADAHVDSTMLERGRLSNRQMARFRRAVDDILALPIKIYDGAATTDFLHYQTMMMMAHESVRLLVVDFAEMLADEGENEEERVSGIFRAAKQIAKVRHIPVIVISQLNRQVEYQASRIPGLHNLRWGGASEQAADSVWLSYYPFAYQSRGEAISVPSDLGYQGSDQYGDPRTKDRVNKSLWYLIVAKNRYGNVGVVKFNVVPEYTLIVDYQEESARDGVVRLSGDDERDF